MENNQRYIELIDRYLNGELSEFELKEFQELLERDPSLENDLAIHKAINQGVQRFGENEITLAIKHAQKNHEIKEAKHLAKIKRYFLIGASGLFCLILGLVVLFNPTESAQQRIDQRKATPISYKEKFHLIEDHSDRVDTSLIIDHLKEIQQEEYEKQERERYITKDKVLDTLFLHVKAMTPIADQMYVWHNDSLNLYGKELHSEAYIVQESQRTFLVDGTEVYPINPTSVKRSLKQVHLRSMESVNQNPIQEVELTEYLFHEIPSHFNIRVLLTDNDKTDSLYIFHDLTLTISQKSFNHLFPNSIDVYYFNDHFYIDHDHHLYTLNDGDNLKFTEQSLDHDTKSILAPNVQHLKIYRSMEKDYLLENSN